jgi:predicted MFS family arabinose efflux permease
VLAVMLACFAGQSFGRFTFGLLLPAMKADLNMSYGLAGWLGTINLFGYLVGTIATSILSLRVAANRLLQIGTVLATVGLIFLASSTSVPALLVGMVCVGFGGAAAWVPAPSVAASVFPTHRRGLAMGVTSGSIGTGIVIAVLLTNAIRTRADNPDIWRTIWWVEAAIGCVGIIATFAFLKPVPPQGSSPPKIGVLRQIPRWWSPTCAYICFGLAYVLFATFVVAGLQTESGFSSAKASFVFAAFGLGNLSGAFLIGRLSDVVGRRFTMTGCYLLCGLCSFTILIVPQPFTYALGWLFGLGMAGSVVSLAAHVGDHISPQAFSAAFGAITAAFGIAQMIGPRLGGRFIDEFGRFDLLFALGGAIWVVGAAFASQVSEGVRGRGSIGG